MNPVKMTLATLLVSSMILTGCNRPQTPTAAVMHVNQTNYDASSKQLTIRGTPGKNDSVGETYVNVNNTEALTGFASYAAPDKPVTSVKVIGLGKPFNIALPEQTDVVTPELGTMAQGSAPVPGVRIDNSIRPAAALSASPAAKRAAIIRVGRSKLGTPYIWGHNEDRGQYGFDCSNYTAYVYHHALGYKMSGASKVQYHLVGKPITRKYAQVGDLVIFEKGKHVGIFAGNNLVLQEGGGLGKVGYISIGPRSYWGKRITVVKRMF